MSPIFAHPWPRFQPRSDGDALPDGIAGIIISCEKPVLCADLKDEWLTISIDSSQRIDPGVLSVDSGRIRDVLKERIGKVAAKVEPFR